MQIYILRDNQQTGPFTEAEVRAQLAAGTITPATVVWWDGLPDWKALSETPLATASTGASLSAAALTPPPVVGAIAGQQKTSGMAIGALVCGVIGFLCAPVLGLAAVVLGHIARSQIKKDPSLTGSGLALGGLILGYVWLVIFVGYLIMIAMMGPKLQQAIMKAQQQAQAQAQKQQDQNQDTNNAPATPPPAAPENPPATPPPAAPDNQPATPPPAAPDNQPATPPATPPANPPATPPSN